ncbi:hypothetical protein M153_1639000144, partial [Pseudoloma neurophilia]
MDGRQQRTSRWNKEALITSVYQSLGQPVQYGHGTLIIYSHWLFIHIGY